MIFKFKEKTTDIKKPLICAILNVTPDSFSDGGNFYNIDDAISRAEELIADGADMLDIGGESTRPSSKYVPIEEEISRVVPVIEEIRKFSEIPISVDTWKAEVAEASIKAGADIINDITGLLGDHKMAETIAKHKAGAIIMFNPVIARPNHNSSKKFPTFGENPFTESELKEFESMEIVKLMQLYFKKSLEIAKQYEIQKEQIMLDPGIGFGMTVKENLTLINNLNVIKSQGYLTYLGVSRKRFIINILEDVGTKLNIKNEEEKKIADYASAMLSAIVAREGIEAIRVHNVNEHKMAIRIGSAIKRPEDEKDIELGEYNNA